MSGNESSDDEVQMFKCRECGEQLTAAEKDLHRAKHNRTKKDKESRRQGQRGSSPTQSTLTLFQPVMSPQPSPLPSPKATPKKKAKKKKIKSNKIVKPTPADTARNNGG